MWSWTVTVVVISTLESMVGAWDVPGRHSHPRKSLRIKGSCRSVDRAWELRNQTQWCVPRHHLETQRDMIQPGAVLTSWDRPWAAAAVTRARRRSTCVGEEEGWWDSDGSIERRTKTPLEMPKHPYRQDLNKCRSGVERLWRCGAHLGGHCAVVAVEVVYSEVEVLVWRVR